MQSALVETFGEIFEVETGQNHAIGDPVALQDAWQLQIPGSDGGRVTKSCIDHEIASLFAILLHALQYTRVERVKEITVAEDERNHRGRIPREALGPGIRAIIHLFQGALDTLAQFGVDVRLVVHDARDRADGDTG